MKQLSNQTLQQAIDKGIDAPSYRIGGSQPKTGIVHIGPGAFFRGHQAWYTHKALQLSGGDWAITAVSMRSAGVSDALTEQDGLYSVAVLDAVNEYQVVGSINEVLVAKREYATVIARLSAESTKYVTLTITEKGYCLNTQGKLDTDSAEIKQDLTGEQPCTTAVGMLVEALAARKQNGFAPLCIVSCDNVTDNGHKLRAALISFAKLKDEDLADWLEQGLICPCTMVDSITPATDDALRALIAEQVGLKDNWPIKRESFVQWVIEDVLPTDRPDWEKAGATLTNDVRGFENAKLRLLNCPHSTMAYLGVLLGHETVYDAMQDQNLVSFIEKLINKEVMPSFTTPAELNVEQYSQDILNRFRNPAIRHLLAQIAWDGSQKLPMRILPIAQQNLVDGHDVQLISIAVAAWMLFIRKRYLEQEELVDPLASVLLDIAASCSGNAEQDVNQFLSLKQVFPTELAQDEIFINSLIAAYVNLKPLLDSEIYPNKLKTLVSELSQGFQNKACC